MIYCAKEFVLKDKHVWDIATKYDVAEGAPNRTLISAFLIMGRNKFRRLPITKIGKIYGILTVTDLMRAVKELGMPDAFKAKIQDYMQPEPKTILLDKTVPEAARIMTEGNFGSLIVVGKAPDKIQGIVTERDILKHCLDPEWKNIKLNSLEMDFKKDLHILDSASPLPKVIEYMADNKVFRVLTSVSQGKINGIISANDITQLIAKERDEFENNPNFLVSLEAKFLSTKDLLTKPMDSTLFDVVQFMSENNIGGVPLTDENGEIVGIFTERMLVAYIANHY